MSSGFNIPPGYYRDRRTGQIRKGIVIRRNGIYPPAPGYKLWSLSPTKYRRKVIQQNIRKYGPKTVHEQLSAIHAFDFRNPNPEVRENSTEDLRYSEQFK